VAAIGKQPARTSIRAGIHASEPEYLPLHKLCKALECRFSNSLNELKMGPGLSHNGVPRTGWMECPATGASPLHWTMETAASAWECWTRGLGSPGPRLWHHDLELPGACAAFALVLCSGRRMPAVLYCITCSSCTCFTQASFMPFGMLHLVGRIPGRQSPRSLLFSALSSPGSWQSPSRLRPQCSPWQPSLCGVSRDGAEKGALPRPGWLLGRAQSFQPQEAVAPLPSRSGLRGPGFQPGHAASLVAWQPVSPNRGEMLPAAAASHRGASAEAHWLGTACVWTSTYSGMRTCEHMCGVGPQLAVLCLGIMYTARKVGCGITWRWIA